MQNCLLLVQLCMCNVSFLDITMNRIGSGWYFIMMMSYGILLLCYWIFFYRLHHWIPERMLTDTDLDSLSVKICWTTLFSQSNFVMIAGRWAIIGCKSGLKCVILWEFDVGGSFVHSSRFEEMIMIVIRFSRWNILTG